jgi:hypothetical protein
MEQVMVQGGGAMVASMNATNYGNLATIGRFNQTLNETLYQTEANLTRALKGGKTIDVWPLM